MSQQRYRQLFIIFVLAFLCTGYSVLASEDIAHTKHNLAVNPDIAATGGVNPNGEICVFCHTPHGGRTDVAGGAAPIWNRRLPPQAGLYTLYTSPNFDAAGTTPGQPKGVSLACLSCHDGTIAFDALINAPGSGGYIAQNKTGSGGPGISAGLNFAGPAVDPTTKTFKAGQRANSNFGGFIFFDANGVALGNQSGGTEPFPNLTTDLSDDHPISFAIPTTDPQFNDLFNHMATANAVDGHTPGSNKVFWLSRTGTIQPDKRDRLRAYPTDTNSIDTPYIECASCHNPHEASRPGGQPAPTDPVNPATVNNSRFLRGANPDLAAAANLTGVYMNDRNAGSVLCLSCHQK